MDLGVYPKYFFQKYKYSVSHNFSIASAWDSIVGDSSE